MPAAAAVPDRKAVGSDQKVTTQPPHPTVMSVSPTIDTTGDLCAIASTRRPAITRITVMPRTGTPAHDGMTGNIDAATYAMTAAATARVTLAYS